MTLTQRLGVVVAPNIPATNTFTVSLAGVPRTGVSIHATVRTSDDATNRTSLDREFLLPDITAPRLVDVMPANGATRQSLWHPPTFLFSETVAADTVTSGRLVLTNDSGVGLPYSVSLSGDNLAAFVSPTNLPLLPGVTYTARLLPGITDASGNALLDSTGSPIPPQGISFTFTTAKFHQIFPTNNTRVIAGQTLPVTFNFEPGLGGAVLPFWDQQRATGRSFCGSQCRERHGVGDDPDQ